MSFIVEVNEIYAKLNSIITSIDAVTVLKPIQAEMVSLANDKPTLDSLFADKATLDSLFADKATLDSLFADKATLDALYADKTALDNIYANLTSLVNVNTNMDGVLDAVNQANSASNSASAAATSETNASTSETNAANSASAAATSETNAANSAASVDANNIIHTVGSGLPNEGYTKAEADIALAKIQGDNTKTFKVADAINADEAVSKNQLTNSNFGFKNYIINGGFDVWQRGTSFSGHSKYYADRWVEYTDTDDGYTVTKVNLNASDITQTGQNKALKVSVTAGTTGSLNDLRQKIEFPEQFNGKTLTLSFWYKSSIPVTVNNIRVDSYINGVDLIHLNPQSINSTTTWQRAQFTFTCSGMDATTLTANDYLDVIISSPVGVTVDYYITGVQLEEGSVATPFEQRPYGLELSLCQRYYQKILLSEPIVTVYTPNGDARNAYPFDTPMRVAPSMTINDSGFNAIWVGDVGTAINIVYPMKAPTANTNSYTLRMNGAAPSVISGAGSVVVGASATTYTITADAEL